MTDGTKVPIGTMLTSAGLLDPRRLAEALAVQRAQGGLIGRILVDMQAVSEADLVKMLGRQLGLRSADLATLPIPPLVIELVSRELAERFDLVPLGVARENGADVLVVGMADPTNAAALDAVRAATGRAVVPVLAGRNAIHATLRRHHESAQEPVAEEPAAPPPRRPVHREAIELPPDDDSPLEVVAAHEFMVDAATAALDLTPVTEDPDLPIETEEPGPPVVVATAPPAAQLLPTGAPPAPRVDMAATVAQLRALVQQGLIDDVLIEDLVNRGLLDAAEVERLKRRPGGP